MTTTAQNLDHLTYYPEAFRPFAKRLLDAMQDALDGDNKSEHGQICKILKCLKDASEPAVYPFWTQRAKALAAEWQELREQAANPEPTPEYDALQALTAEDRQFLRDEAARAMADPDDHEIKAALDYEDAVEEQEAELEAHREQLLAHGDAALPPSKPKPRYRQMTYESGVSPFPHCYDPWHVTASDGRVWKIMADASLSDVDFDYRVELVTPILEYGDMKTFQDVVRALRKAGAKASKNSSVHLHVSSEPHTARSIRNLVKTFNRLEHLLYKAVGVQESRQRQYCRPNAEDFVERLDRMRSISDRSLNRAWFGTYTPQPAHYCAQRYASLNLSNIWRIGTIEFRFGEVWPRIHAGKIRAYICLCLALSAYALNSRAATKRRKKHDGNEKYALRVALNGIGLCGPQFRTVRKHLLENMPGNAAWRNPNQRRTTHETNQTTA